MRRIISFLLILIAIAANARQVSPDEAQSVAAEFFGSSNGPMHVSLNGIMRVAPNNATADYQPYYIFNAADNAGFVIISGDDRARKILGYSDKGEFDFNNLPPQLDWLLNEYRKQIESISATASQDPSWQSTETTASEDGVVLETANWGQGAPYNAQCPIIDGVQAPTGCVATAMAIVMKYHNWPENYNWDAMPVSDVTAENSSETGKLMADAGKAVFMNYGSSESGANMNWVGHKLQQDFKYSPDCQYITAQNFSNEEWICMLRSNIDNGQPVIYSGTDKSTWVGHAFIIDGYNNTGYHINWGWEGICNGYYTLDALRPGENGDYSSDSGMVINITPDRSGKTYSKCFLDYGYFWAVGGQVPGINLSCDNLESNVEFDVYVPSVTCPAGFDGYIGLALIDANDNIKKIIGTRWAPTWSDADQTYTTSGYELNIYATKIEGNIDPSDRLHVVSKENGSTEWKLVLGTIETPSYIEVSNVKANLCDVHITIGNPDLRVQFFKSGDWVDCSYPEANFTAVKGNPLQFSAYAPENSTDDGFVVFSIIGKDLYGDHYTKSDQNQVDYAANSFGDNYEVDVDYVIAKDDLSINCEIAGHLKDYIPIEECFSISGLTLSGKINATDIWYIRDNLTNLKKLDMSKAEIEACVAEDPKNAGFTDPDNLANFIPRFSFTNLMNLKTIILPETLVGVSDYGLINTQISLIDIPRMVNYIGLNAFSGCFNLETVICRNPQPVGILECAFTDTKCPKNGILYVPTGSAEAYKEANIWQDFSQIIACDDPYLFTEEYEENGLKYKIRGKYAMITGFVAEKISPNVIIPETITINGQLLPVVEIGANAFENSEVESISMSDNIEVIGHSCFLNTTAKQIRLSDNIKELPAGSLSSIWIENVNLPTSLKILDSPMFNMRSLKQLHIPAGAKRANNRFNIGSHFNSLEEITIDPLNEDMCVIDGVLFNKEASLLLNYPGLKKGAYTIPNSVTKIADESFVGCSELTELYFTDNLIEIGGSAIGECEKLEHLALPSMCSIRSAAISNLPNLRSLALGDVVFDDKVIHHCYSLKNIYLLNKKYLNIEDIVYKYTEDTGIYDYYHQEINPTISVSKFNMIYVPGATYESFVEFGDDKVKEMWRYDIDRTHNLMRIEPAIEGIDINSVLVNGETASPKSVCYYEITPSNNLDVVVNYTLHNRQEMTTHYDAEFNAQMPNTELSLPVSVSSIEITPASVTDVVGTKCQLTVAVMPENATNKAVEWNSDNTEVATVDANGLVRLLAQGTATITATATDGSGVQAQCTVIVNMSTGIENMLVDADTDVTIYSTTGVLLFEGRYSDAILNKGIYIVVTPDKQFKRLIK